ncbi:uncharacterized protein Z518_04809 [Rhinocladiella mackenziei CBS 650.93]|uniref:Rhinocladiella mackenziei CBS 650.93 unplaced genomic scaffold supercont1.3, whole genome shotgun sequence n=1 Tax=Rhinocladiella mackenziei CBS 650.93 TaxID=1442369 RepID=A0A0D2H8P0_9EURO|nr:uncharacterized protein Z518_04809 [Rhinocladiella mackenziei CBS 650.93]KIX06833.1 hypothetical protein Z518_04809 [Rhinocladiella mackenziei CBS 650.93]
MGTPGEQYTARLANIPVNHVAISVPDIEAAIKWYTEILGFRKLRKSVRVQDRKVNPNANIFKIYGDRLHEAKVAYLSASNGVGIELFQFIDPPFKQQADFDYTRGGVFHVGLTVADPEEVCKRAVAAGAKKIGQSVVPYRHLGEDDVALYMQDPWGMVIELMSCSFEQFFANRPES